MVEGRSNFNFRLEGDVVLPDWLLDGSLGGHESGQALTGSVLSVLGSVVAEHACTGRSLLEGRLHFSLGGDVGYCNAFSMP